MTLKQKILAMTKRTDGDQVIRLNQYFTLVTRNIDRYGVNVSLSGNPAAETRMYLVTKDQTQYRIVIGDYDSMIDQINHCMRHYFEILAYQLASDLSNGYDPYI